MEAVLQFYHVHCTAALCPRTKGRSPVFGQVTELQTFLGTFLDGVAETPLLRAGLPSSFPCHMLVASKKCALKKATLDPEDLQQSMKEKKTMAADTENDSDKQFPGLKTLAGLCLCHTPCAFRHIHSQRGSWPHTVNY